MGSSTALGAGAGEEGLPVDLDPGGVGVGEGGGQSLGLGTVLAQQRGRRAADLRPRRGNSSARAQHRVGAELEEARRALGSEGARRRRKSGPARAPGGPSSRGEVACSASEQLAGEVGDDRDLGRVRARGPRRPPRARPASAPCDGEWKAWVTRSRVVLLPCSLKRSASSQRLLFLAGDDGRLGPVDRGDRESLLDARERLADLVLAGARSPPSRRPRAARPSAGRGRRPARRRPAARARRRRGPRRARRSSARRGSRARSPQLSSSRKSATSSAKRAGWVNWVWSSSAASALSGAAKRSSFSGRSRCGSNSRAERVERLGEDREGLGSSSSPHAGALGALAGEEEGGLAGARP